MKKYLRITIVLVIFLTAVLFHDLHGGSRKFASAAGNAAASSTGTSIPTTDAAPGPAPETFSTPGPAASTPASTSASMPTPTPTLAAAVPSIPAPSPTPTPRNAGQYKDGTYTGSPADAYYGALQVQAVVANGRLINVNFLQYPNHTRTSQRINQQVMPWLTQEAVQAQSASINVISGASASSDAFAQSLNSALAQAK